MPPNVTAVIQPMDQNPIKTFKLKYRNKLLCNILADPNESIQDQLKKHTIRDAILLMHPAWTEMPQSVLKNAWNRIFNWDDGEYDDEDDLPLSELFDTGNVFEAIVQETQQLLSEVAPTCTITSQEVIEWNDDIE